MKKILSLLIMLFSFQRFSFSQDQHLIDSLQAQLKNHNATKTEMQIKSPSLYDTTAANILYELFKASWGNNPDKGMDYANQCLALSTQIDFKKGMGNAFNGMGIINTNKGDFLPALEFYKKALKIREEIDDKKGLASIYSNIGRIYDYQGNYSEALKNYFIALKIREETGDRSHLSGSYINIGIIYDEQGNYPEALKNYLASLKIDKEYGNKRGVADDYNNIGLNNMYQGNYPEALKNHFASLKIYEEIGDKQGVGRSYMNIGIIYNKENNYPLALKNHFAGLKIQEETGNKDDITESYINIGDIYAEQKKYRDALQYLNKALSISKEIGLLARTKECYYSLAYIDSAQGNLKQELEHFKLYISTRDSLVNNVNTKKTVQQQMEYDFDKKQVSDSLKFAQEKELGAVKLQKQKAITYGGFAGIAITIILLFFVYRNYNKQRIANIQLKEAQEQLIKSEKMVAFGVMASRVSHEIQNPLNFVNNFSELSKEMVHDVIKSQSEEEKKQYADSLIANLEKINEHGKRAASIVKQLQEHSTKGTAQEFFEANQQ